MVTELTTDDSSTLLNRVSGRLVTYRHVKTERESKAQQLQDALAAPSLYTFLSTRDTTLRRIFFLEEYVRQARFQLKFEESQLEQRALALKHRRDIIQAQVQHRKQQWKQSIPQSPKEERMLAAIREKWNLQRSAILLELGKEMGITREGLIRNLQIARPAEMSTADRKMLNSALGYTVQFVNAAARYAGEILPHRLMFSGSTSYAQTTYATPSSKIPSQLPLYLQEDHRESFIFSYALLLYNILHLIKALQYPLPRIQGNANLLIECLNVLTRQQNRMLLRSQFMPAHQRAHQANIDFSVLLKEVKEFFYNEPSYFESDVGGFNLINAPGWSLPTQGQPTTSATTETVTVTVTGQARPESSTGKRNSGNMPILPVASWWQYQPSFHESVFFQDQAEMDRSVAQAASGYSSYVTVPSHIQASTIGINTNAGSMMRSGASPSSAVTDRSETSSTFADDRRYPEAEIMAMRMGNRSASPGLAGLASLVNATSSAETIGIRGRKSRYLRRQLAPLPPRAGDIPGSPVTATPTGIPPPLRSSRAQSSSGVSSPEDSDWHVLDRNTPIPHSNAYAKAASTSVSSTLYRKSSTAVSTVWNSHVMGILTPIGRAVQKHTPPVLSNAVQYGKNFVTSALPPDDSAGLPADRR